MESNEVKLGQGWLGNVTISAEPTFTGLETISIGSGIDSISLSPSYSISDNVLAGAIGAGSNAIWTTGTGTGINPVPTWTTTSPYIVSSPATMDGAGKLTLQGEKADIDINGKSLKSWMEKVEERLNILTPNPELEKDWDDLRRLGERYRKLEKRCKEKAEVWKKLKSMPPPKMD